MVEGPTAKAYAIRISKEFRNEIVQEIFTRSKKIFVPIEEFMERDLRDPIALVKT